MNLGRKFSTGPATAPPSASVNSTPVTRARYRLLAGLLVLFALGFVFISSRRSNVADIPLPPDLHKLEPQLREYILEVASQVRKHPADSFQHINLGLVFAANALWPEARAAFSNVVGLKPEEPLGHLYYAIAWQECGEQSEALRLYREVTRKFPSFPHGYYRLGELSLRIGDIAEGQEAFQTLIRLAPAEWRGYAGLGDALLRQGLFAAAADQLKKALELNPHAKEAHHLLGLAYRGLNRTDEAERELRLGLNAAHYPMPDPWGAAAVQHTVLLPEQLDIANAYLQEGNPAKAIKILENALKWHAQNLTVYNQLALAYLAAGAPGRASDVCRAALQVNPRNLLALVSLSTSCLDLGKPDEALSYANQAVQVAPELPQGHLARATALRVLGQHQEALASLQSALRSDPRNAYIYLEIGDLYQGQLGQPQQAVRHYQTAAEIDPVLGPAWLRLADLYSRNGQKAEALNALEKLKMLEPAEPSIKTIEERVRSHPPP